MLVIGIDPGKNGGIAVIDSSTLALVSVEKMPQTPTDLIDMVMAVSKCGQCFAYLERVGGMPGQGGAASFNFGQNYGHIEMALVASGIPTETVPPAKWQRYLNLQGKKGESKTDHKNRMKARAQQLFPSQKVTLWAADALLIAKYGLEQICHNRK